MSYTYLSNITEKIIFKRKITFSIILALLCSLFIQYFWIVIAILLFAYLFILYGERYVLFFVIVTLFTLVGDVSESLRSVIHIVDFSLLALLFLHRYGLKTHEYPRLPGALTYFLLFYYFSMIISTIFSAYFFEGLFLIFRQTIFFVVAYLIFGLIRDMKDFKTIFYSLIIVSLIISVSIIYNMLASGSGLFDFLAGIRLRFSGLIANIDTATTFFIISFPLMIIGYYLPGNRNRKFLLGLILFVVVIGSIIALSRSSILAILFSTAFIYYYLNRPLLKKIIVVIAFITILFVVIPSLNEAAGFFFRIEEGLSQRQYFWQIAVNIIKDHPIFGIGPGAYSYEWFNYFPVLFSSWVGKVMINLNQISFGTNNSHNFFLFFFSDMGIFGLITSFALVIVFFRITFKTINLYSTSKSNDYYYVIALAASGSSMFIRGIVDTIGFLTYGYITADLPFWLILMCLIYFYNKKKTDLSTSAAQ